jgi:hypothetical protein
MSTILSDVWMYDPNNTYLVSPTKVLDSSKVIKRAQSFTISFMSCVLVKNFENRRHDDNDVLIMTRTIVGNKPKVERIHFWEKDIPVQRTIDDIWAPNVVAVEDYNGKDRVVIEWNVIEVDSNDEDRRKSIDSLLRISNKFGSTFPVLVPYVAAARSIIGLVRRVVERAQKDEYVIRARFALETGEGDIDNSFGLTFLQPATYVMFEKEVYGQKYMLKEDRRLYLKDSRDRDDGRISDVSDVSYVVFNVRPVFSIAHDKLVGENLATLMTQIRDKEDTPAAEFTIDFISETVDAYTLQKKVQRYVKLARKSNRTEAEEVRFQELENDDQVIDFVEDFR